MTEFFTFKVGDLVEVIDANGSSDPALAEGTRHTIVECDPPGDNQYVLLNRALGWLTAKRVRLIARDYTPSECSPFQPGDVVEVIDARGSSDPRLDLGTQHTVAFVGHTMASELLQLVKFTTPGVPSLYAERLRLVYRPTETQENTDMPINLHTEIERGPAPVTGVRITLTPAQLRYITALIGKSNSTDDREILGADYPREGMIPLYDALRKAGKNI